MADRLDSIVESYREDMVKHLSELVKIPSVSVDAEGEYPFGKDVHDAMQYTLNLGRQLGFDTVKDVDGYAGYFEVGSGEEMIGVLVHLDVVPAATGWSVEPFGGVVQNNRVYGRGAMDNKGPAISAIYALKALLDTNPDFAKRVRIIFGGSEERGMACIRHYIDVEESPTYAFSPDGEYPIINIEKAMMSVSIKKDYQPGSYGPKIKYIKAGTRGNLVPDLAKMLLVGEDMVTDQAILQDAADHHGYAVQFEQKPDGLHVTVTGVSAHASRPEDGKNALGQLLEMMRRLPDGDDGLLLAAKQLGERLGDTTDGNRICLNLEDEQSGKMTVNLGVMEADEYKLNLKIDMRCPISVSPEEAMQLYAEGFANTGCECVLDFCSPGHMVEESHPLVQKLLAAYHEKTGLAPYCMAIGGGTYARMFRNKAVAFGPAFPGKPALYHVPDEYYDIDEMVLNAQIFAKALQDLACEEW
ncbi:Sapep family Mn(2+)-dependent dipeptidase [Eubacteriales bacterium OttesenSCG-928-N14]|nr:Sapep family Mn(2+)-dependent dipeptidase [Eubacteriales bacterium OttesenSCG-928-N14]